MARKPKAKEPEVWMPELPCYVRCIESDNRGLVVKEHIYKVVDQTTIDFVIEFEDARGNLKQVWFRKSRFVKES